MVFDYNQFNEAKNSGLIKLTYSLAGKAWNELWETGKFKWKPKNSDIIIEMEYMGDDEGLFKAYRYTNDNYPGYKSLGKKYFHGIPEERDLFFEWLKSIGILE